MVWWWAPSAPRGGGVWGSVCMYVGCRAGTAGVGGGRGVGEGPCVLFVCVAGQTWVAFWRWARPRGMQFVKDPTVTLWWDPCRVDAGRAVRRRMGVGGQGSYELGRAGCVVLVCGCVCLGRVCERWA